MKNFAPVCITLICILALSYLPFGCTGRRVEELKKEMLFTIPIGQGLEEIGVVREKNGQYSGPSAVLFKNGFFYVVDQVNQKLLKVTSPGDIILTLSKGGSGEPPEEENLLRLKERKNYPFNLIGQITVDSENNIYVEDKIVQKGPETNEIDVLGTGADGTGNGDEIYVSNIIKFDRLGRYLYTLGKNGRGAEPFFYVYKMQVDSEGNLVVLTGEEGWQKWTYYKYDSHGRLLFYQVISTDQIFNVRDMEVVEYYILDVLPVKNENSLMFWVSLYDTSSDTTTIKKEEEIWGEEIEIVNTENVKGSDAKKEEQDKRDLLYYKLLYYDLESRAIEKSYRWENRIDGQFSPTEELFGIDGKANGFLWKYLDTTRTIVSIFRPNGTQVAKRIFVLEDNGMWSDVCVAEDGSVTGVKMDETTLNFYRWRSDELINSKSQKVSLKEFILDKVEEFKNANR